MTDDLKIIDKTTQNMKADSAKYNRLTKEMIKGVTVGLDAVTIPRDLEVKIIGDDEGSHRDDFQGSG